MPLRIIFMGTPEFAVPTLQTLVEEGYDVVAVITATDKMGGRGGKQLLQSAVKKYAISQNIPVLQPKNLKAPQFIETLATFKADLQVVVAFRMLPEVVWAMPPLGTFNLHGSLLPKYRGAAPIHWAVINGEKETGVTTFFIQQKIDTGDLLFQEKMPINENDTTGDVHDRMMILGADTVLKTVKAIENKEINPVVQQHELATPAPKLNSKNTHINFDQPTKLVHNFIRGLSPYPAAWSLLDGKKWKILRTLPLISSHQHKPGTIVSDGKTFFRVATKDGFVDIKELQVPGKRRMPVQSFLNGWHKNEEEQIFK